MREWISLLEDENSQDFSFVANLSNLLNINKDEIANIIEKLSMDELSNLVDATMKNDQTTAQQIISNSSNPENTIDQDTNTDNSETPNDSDTTETNEEEELNDLIVKNNKKTKAKRSREDYGIDETAESLTLNIGDKVFVDDEEGTVKIPNAPGNTIGVMIDGELQMINKNKVHVKEGVLGMTPMPGLRPSADNDLQRMKELAGIRGDDSIDAPIEVEAEPVSPVGMEPEAPMAPEMGTDEPTPAMDMDEPSSLPMTPPSPMEPLPPMAGPMDGIEDGAESIERAISDIEAHIPNVSISDYKSIVARLKALVSMAENAGRTALSESKKAKVKEAEKNFSISADFRSNKIIDKKFEDPKSHGAFSLKNKEVQEDKIEVKKPKEKHNVETSGSEVTRKTLMDYIKEQDETETLGVNRNDALKTIQNRLGKNGNPQSANQALNSLTSAGKIKQQNGTFAMNSMSDDDFFNTIGQTNPNPTNNSN